MTLQEFYSLVSAEVNRGTALDTYIPGRVAMAARRIERNYTYKYMEMFALLTLDPNSLEPRAIPFGNNRVKSFRFIRYVKSDGTFVYLKQIEPKELLSVEAGLPHGFWMDGMYYLWLDTRPEEEVVFELSFSQYTDWEAWNVNDVLAPWLVVNGKDCLLAQTMLLLAPLAREDTWPALYGRMREEAEKTLFLADEELRGSVRDEEMRYEPFGPNG